MSRPLWRHIRRGFFSVAVSVVAGPSFTMTAQLALQLFAALGTRNRPERIANRLARMVPLLPLATAWVLDPDGRYGLLGIVHAEQPAFSLGRVSLFTVALFSRNEGAFQIDALVLRILQDFALTG